MPAQSHSEATRDLADSGSSEHTKSGAEPGQFTAVPRQIGRYFPLALLGSGGMGVVYAAYDPGLDRKVALKLVRPDRSHPGASARLLREAQAQARISHPHVVQIHDTGMIDDQLYLAMEFVAGVDLRAWLTTPRSQAARLEAFIAAGRGLAAAHHAGLVHRDFKPENVLVGDDGRVRVTDFGLARPGADMRTTDPSRPRRDGQALELMLTAPGDVLGTPAYMSPEQHRGLPVDARSDQFSYCVALWEALYGQRPFAGGDPVALARAVVAGALVPPPAEARVARTIEAALRRGLADRPEQRHPDMHALLAELVRDPARVRRQRVLALTLTTAGVLGGLGLARTWSVEEAPCSGAAAALAASWDPDRRAAVAGALAAAGSEEVQALVLAGLDAYAESWVRGHRDACLDHRRGEQSSALLDARVRCLERRREAMDGTITALLAEGTGLDAAQMVARLPSLAACDDPETALAGATRPTDPTLARAVVAVEARLDAALARHHGGDLTGALARARAALLEARQLGERSLQAQALLTLGTIQSLNYTELESARVALAEAATEALTAGRDDLAAEAFARKLYLDGVVGGAPEAALEAAPMALALASRAPEPHAALGLALNNIGAVHDTRGDRFAAAAATARALAEMSASPQQDPIELANATYNAAMTTEAPADRRALVRRAVDLYTTHLGAGHRITLARQALRAQYEPDPRDGLALLAETCPRYAALERPDPLYCGECWYDLGQFAALLGDPRQAEAALARVGACEGDSAGDPWQALRDEQVAALAALLVGDGARALAAADAGLRRTAAARGELWADRGQDQLELLRGQALRSLGRAPEAVAPLERAVDGLTREGASRPALLPRLWLAHAQADLAAVLRALPGPQAARADELARASAATLAALGLPEG